MIRAGLMADVDVMMDWHPAAETKTVVQKGLAMVDFIVEFNGQAAHAASDPWNGRSASDALELYTNGINYYREHIKPTVRIHYHIQDGRTGCQRGAGLQPIMGTCSGFKSGGTRAGLEAD